MEGGLRHLTTWIVDGRPRRGVAPRKPRASRSPPSCRPCFLVRGRRLGSRTARPPPHRDRVGEGAYPASGPASGKAAPVAVRTTAATRPRRRGPAAGGGPLV